MPKENMWRQRRVPVPKRTIELIALIAISSTLFLFLHTRDLHSFLKKMEVRLQPGEDDVLSANQLSSEKHIKIILLIKYSNQTSYDHHKSALIISRVARETREICTFKSYSPVERKKQPSIHRVKDKGCSPEAELTEQLRVATSKGGERKNIGEHGIQMDSDSNSIVHYPNVQRIFVEKYEDEEVLDIDTLNNTKRADRQVLFFNRVPKVGSQTFMELLRRLSIRNAFSFNRDRVQRVETIRLAPIEQLHLARMVSSYLEPSVYVKHVCFTNFTEFHLPEPIYINIVRDPVERVISWYYYVRAPWYYVERKQIFPDLPLPDPNWLKKDFESCVLKGDRECRYLQGEIHEGIGDHRRQTLFFCGHSEKCTPFNTIGALERAKLAVEKHYAVVGVLEDINTTLTVLENYIPRFFQGATDVYYDQTNSFMRINRNFFKPPVSEEVKNLVRSNFTREVEFYQFCKQRLYRQYRALKLRSNVP
ncbi:PREDICTED: heparan sulfate 2-O-sulfotransferase pipe [Atta colombica]|uniref:heparan sulfate 2-O-sulfotransferase pipe n=1 Tax=Atta colombica TaxID=520822 RepID=UPI00084C4E54|nr:PREDICTED: heparan sulfate 2-O-sulfotransferase pipe [Atta colombica]